MSTSMIPQGKRMAMGEKVTGMKTGGYVKRARETAGSAKSADAMATKPSRKKRDKSSKDC